jgi:hypothetical protein
MNNPLDNPFNECNETKFEPSISKTLCENHFRFQILYSEFLRTIRCKTKLLANCLAAGDKLGLANATDITSTVFSGLYGSCLMHEDEVLVLR